MKKVLSRIVIGVLAMSFVACDMNDPNEDKFANDPQSGYVEFLDETTIVLSGVDTEFRVPIVLDAPVNSDGVTVNYSVTPVDGSIDFLSYSGAAVIPAGQRIGYAVFTMPQTVLTSCVQFNVTLTGTSRDNVGIGFIDENNNSFLTNLVTIGKGRDAFIGTYNVVEGTDEYVAVISAGEEPNELIINNLFGIDPESETHIFLESYSANGNIDYPVFADNFLFTSSNAGQGDVFVSNDFENLQVNPDGTPAPFIPSSFNPCDMSLNLNYFLVFGPTQSLTSPGLGSINAVFTKQP